ncbi:hypothetical protein [Tenacibaculum aiptasiae]|uniref:hypothetical protein n=1 Tax=Tenacibaculum aiptasiae TaxID=426481 RepID=UPI0023301DF8|nr:hypothetical protein [Tenacibaculum aiptasiae]
MTNVDNIKVLWREIKYKTGFIGKAAKHFNKRPSTLKNHWFSNVGFWSVPENLQDDVIEYMKNYISLQNEV